MIRVVLVGVGIWLTCCQSMVATIPPPPLRAPLCPTQMQATGFNTARRGNVIVLGRPDNARYVVVVPVRHPNTLEVVRRCVPDAFLAESSLGAYVHAGAFADRSPAEKLSVLLRSRGLDARVVYFP